MDYSLVIIASILYGVVPTVQNLVLEEGVSAYGLIACFGTMNIFTALLSCKFEHASIKVNKKQFYLLLLAGFCMYMTDLGLELSYAYIPIGFATMIHFTYPTVICVICALFFKEKINWYKIIAIGCSISGMYFLAGSDFSGDFLGIPIAFSTALFYSAYMLLVDKTAIAEVPATTRTFYSSCFFAFIAIIMTIKTKGTICSTPKQWFLAFIVSLMMYYAALFLTKGITRLSAGTVSFLNMIEPLTSFIVSTIVFQYSLATKSILGCVLIVLSLIPIAINANKAS